MPLQLTISRAAMDTLITSYADLAQQQLDILIKTAQRDQHGGVYRDDQFVVMLDRGSMTIVTNAEFSARN